MTDEQLEQIYEDAFSIAVDRMLMNDEAHEYAQERVNDEVERYKNAN